MDGLPAAMYDTLIMALRESTQVHYFSPPPMLQKQGLYCLDAGAAIVPPGENYPLHVERHPREYRSLRTTGRRLQEYQVVFIRRGEGSFWGEGQQLARVTSGTVLVLVPGWWHRYMPNPLTGWDEVWVGFSGAETAELFQLLRLEPGKIEIPPGPAFHELTELFQQILRIAIRPDILDHIQLGGLIRELLVYLRRVTRGEKGAEWEDQRFERAREVMMHALMRPLAMKEVYRAAGCSRATLQRLFNERTGVSPYRYYLALRIDAATWVLANTQRGLKEIAREYGFSDEYHFSRVFRSMRGVAPGAWRSRQEREKRIS